ncbi:hypothetical protein NE865_11183 [Phthorimaea operculella]|nr:hypothetical protein NE865_11183 [Phthorimaea operculella]
MGDALRERLPALWRRIEDAHYSYLETDDSPEKLQQRNKLEGYITEYLSLVPHECKFGLSETGKVFQRTINELPEFSAYRAGLGWAALARYAANLLAQPWRKEYRDIRLYCGYYKHEIEANMVGAETLLHTMGYKCVGQGKLSLVAPVCPDMVAAVSRDAIIAHAECQVRCYYTLWGTSVWARGNYPCSASVPRHGGRSQSRRHHSSCRVPGEMLLHTMGYKCVGQGKLSLVAPVCPDMVAAVSRDAIIAHAECQIMSQIWESVWSSGVRISWADVARERAARASDAAAAAARLAAGITDRNNISYIDGSEIYSNVPLPVQNYDRPDDRYNNSMPCGHLYDDTPIEDPITPMVHPYMVPQNMVPPIMYPIPHPEVTQVPMMTPYGVPYYYPVQAPYMIPTPVFAPIKQANNIPLNGYPQVPQYRYPTVPTGQLIELETPSVYENGKHYKEEDRHRRRHGESSRKDSTSKSNFSDISLPSIPRSDTQPALSKAKEDGMGTYESWDYVFRNLSSKNDEGDKNRYSPSFDSRTLDRLDRDERRSKYQPTTLDLEDGLRAMNLDRTSDEDAYRTAKVNENLMKLKLEQEKKARLKNAKIDVKRKIEKPEPVVVNADALVTAKVAADKVKLLSKKEIKDRKEVIRQQSTNGGPPSAAEVRKLKKPAKLLAEVEKNKPMQNGHGSAHTSKDPPQPYDLKAQLIVSLDETDSNSSRAAQTNHTNGRRAPDTHQWQCTTCTFINKDTNQACEMCGKSKKGPEIQPLTSGGRECPACTLVNQRDARACEMCGKSKKGPEIQPLTSGGRECPACTLVNQRDARVCDACGTSLEHCPTYI